MRVRVPAVLLALSALLLLAGAIGGMYGMVDGLRLRGHAWTTPGAQDLELEPGTWVIYEQTTDTGADPSVPLRRIAVYGPSGSQALSCVSCAGSHQSMLVNSTAYVGIAQFTVATAGTYRITVTDLGHTVMVAPSVVGGVVAFAGGFLLAVIGALGCFLAIIWLVIGAVTRPRGQPRQPDSGPEPAA